MKVAFDPLALTNRNLYVHTHREDWPYSGAVLAIHIARLISVLAGIGTLIATYGLARTLFPRRPEAALAVERGVTLRRRLPTLVLATPFRFALIVPVSGGRAIGGRCRSDAAGQRESADARRRGWKPR
jgi:ABC-type phosphate/phosphonate transport system permease subunit